MRFSTLFIDLDDTIYPASSGLWTEILARINRYMGEHLGFSQEQIGVLREQYFREYGTTLRGLQLNGQVDVHDYLAFVHDVPLARYLRPDPALRAALETISARKYIFTNADSAHAERVLKHTRLEGLFDGIIDIHAMAPFCKPMPEAFAAALRLAGSPEPQACLLLDDQARTTRAGRALGMATVLVGHETAAGEADAALPELAGLPSLITRLSAE
jgi:putative hydrolase of the HAD superfamily